MAKILILDGGLGTSLEQNHDITFTPATPLWSSHLLISEADRPTLLRCQSAFGDVPVDIILTATYQISLEGFASTKTAEFPDGIPPSLVPRFLDAAVDIAEQAGRNSSSRIALSIGPYGACMVPSQEYSGRYDAPRDSGDGLLAWHRERMRLFAGIRDVKARVSHLALETIPRVDEIVALRRALDSVPDLASPSPGIPFWTSCLFPNEDENLPDGTPPEDAVRAMLDPRLARAVPWAIGINCTKVRKLDALLRRYESAVRGMLREGLAREWPALVLYPDGTNGQVYSTATGRWELPGEAAGEERAPWEHQLAEVVRSTGERGRWRQIVVGGCCMSRPDDIRRLRSRLLQFQDSE